MHIIHEWYYVVYRRDIVVTECSQISVEVVPTGVLLKEGQICVVREVERVCTT